MPHYEVRFQDGLTPFDARTKEDLDAVFRENPVFEDRLMTIRGVGFKPVTLEDLLG